MRILFILPHYNLDAVKSGSTARTYNIVKNLSKKHKITVLQCDGKKAIPNVKTVNFKPVWLFGKHPSFLLKHSSDFRQKLEELLNNYKFDKVVHEFPWNFPYVYSRVRRKEIPLIYEAHNVETFNVVSSWKSRLGILRFLLPLVEKTVAEHERMACENADEVVVVSERDAKTFKKLFGRDAIVVPNGVNNEEFNKSSRMTGLPKKKILVFHGTGRYLANDDAVAKLKKIARNLSDKWFIIIAGSGMPKFEYENIRSVGFVKDVSLLLGSADAAIVPIEYGSGTRLKILEYFAAGLPVLATAKAVEGLGVRNGKDFVLLKGFGDKEVMEKLDLIEKKKAAIVRNAKKRALKHDWKKISQIYDKEVFRKSL